MARSSAVQTDFEELRLDNSHLNTTVSELRLEIAYYQGETKRLEWEKNLLKQDVGKMSALFKGWLSELQNSNTRSVLDDSDFFTNLVKYPSKNISDVLQMSDAKLLITTCQAPFYIEVLYTSWRPFASIHPSFIAAGKPFQVPIYKTVTVAPASFFHSYQSHENAFAMATNTPSVLPTVSYAELQLHFSHQSVTD